MHFSRNPHIILPADGSDFAAEINGVLGGNGWAWDYKIPMFFDRLSYPHFEVSEWAPILGNEAQMRSLDRYLEMQPSLVWQL